MWSPARRRRPNSSRGVVRTKEGTHKGCPYGDSKSRPEVRTVDRRLSAKLATMPVTLSDTRETLVSAGADEAKAKAAVEEIAHFDRRLNRIEVLPGIVVALQIATFGAAIFK